MTRRRDPDRMDALVALTVALAGLAVYLRTLAPGLLPGDSGEFQFLARFTGHAHTTGYPVFLLVARLVAGLHAAGTAFRVNLLSALMAAAALGTLFFAARYAGASRAGAIAGIAALALSSTWWSQATIAEIYAPGAAVAAGVLLSAILWWRTRRARFLFAAGCLGGVGMGVQVSIVLLLPAVLVLMITARPARIGAWAAAGAGALLGAAVTVFCFALVDRAGGSHDIFATVYRPAAPLWGLRPEDLDSPVERFRFLFGARQWRGTMFADPLAVMPRQALGYLRVLFADFSPVAVLLAAIGAVALTLRDHRLGPALLAGLAAHLLYVFNYPVWDVRSFYITGYLLLAIMLAAGADAVLSLARRTRLVPGAATSPILCAVLFAAILWPVAGPAAARLRDGEAQFTFTGLPGHAGLRAWHEQLLRTVRRLDENALLFAGWDDLYPAMYVARIEENRGDLRFAQADPFAAGPDRADVILPIVQAALAERPVYTTAPLHGLDGSGLRLEPVRETSPDEAALYRVVAVPAKAVSPRSVPAGAR